MNKNHDPKTGEFTSGPGGGHEQWARDFNNEPWAVMKNNAAVRSHMHTNNTEVKVAAKRVDSAKKAAAAFEFADPRDGYKPTPPNIQAELKEAQSALRSVEKAARKSVGR